MFICSSLNWFGLFCLKLQWPKIDMTNGYDLKHLKLPSRNKKNEHSTKSLLLKVLSQVPPIDVLIKLQWCGGCEVCDIPLNYIVLRANSSQLSHICNSLPELLWGEYGGSCGLTLIRSRWNLSLTAEELQPWFQHPRLSYQRHLY